MNTGAATFGIPHPVGGTKEVKEQLKKLVRIVERPNGTVILALDTMEADTVAPLYNVFSAAWRVAEVRDSVLTRVGTAPILEDVKFDLLFIEC